MEACTRSLPASVARPISPLVLLMGLSLGALTGTALWALRPEVCSQLCSVHAFLAAILALTFSLYVAFGRRDGLPSAVSFVLSFSFGVMLVALVVSAARISSRGEEVMLEPEARLTDTGAVRPA